MATTITPTSFQRGWFQKYPDSQPYGCGDGLIFAAGTTPDTLRERLLENGWQRVTARLFTKTIGEQSFSAEIFSQYTDVWQIQFTEYKK